MVPAHTIVFIVTMLTLIGDFSRFFKNAKTCKLVGSLFRRKVFTPLLVPVGVLNHKLDTNFFLFPDHTVGVVTAAVALLPALLHLVTAAAK